jgi:hypothetical protein
VATGESFADRITEVTSSAAAGGGLISPIAKITPAKQLALRNGIPQALPHSTPSVISLSLLPSGKDE